MNTLRNFLIINILLFLLGSCKKEGSGLNDTNAYFTGNQEKILKSSNSFGLKIFRDIIDSSGDDNVFISPLSVSLALTMAYDGASGQTATDIQNTLGFEGMSKEEINSSCKELINTIVNLDSKVLMEIANSIWYRNTFIVKKDFENINKNYFNAEVKPADFNNPSTIDLINGWVSNTTHERIKTVINSIDGNMLMYLINAIYFKGTWKYKFETKNTLKEPFYLFDCQSYNVDFMVQQDTFKYMSNDLLTAVELPYGDGKFSMVILLPGEQKNHLDVIQNLDADHWREWTEALERQVVQVHLPKFKFSYEKQLNENLTNLGMGIAFNDQADFSNISETTDLCISFVLHKSFVEVNEEGTEAAAITVVGIVGTSIGEHYKILYINKPFVFAIKENVNNNILFLGLFKKPVSD
jgi:serine protease inhibitor